MNRCRDGSVSSIASAEREPSAFRAIEEAAQRLSTRNKRLTPELALHLGPPRRPAGTPTASIAGSSIIISGRGRRIGCHRTNMSPCGRALPVQPCLMSGRRKLSSRSRGCRPARAFQAAELQKIAGAGHWLHHDRLDVVLASLRRFLDAPQPAQAR
jgi:hypothetical protein